MLTIEYMKSVKPSRTTTNDPPIYTVTLKAEGSEVEVDWYMKQLASIGNKEKDDE